MEGNLWAAKRVQYVKDLLNEIGLGGERPEMYYLSSAEGARFARIAAEMTEWVRRPAPVPSDLESVVRWNREKWSVEQHDL